MRNRNFVLITLAALVSVFFGFGAAEAGQDCHDKKSTACDVYKRQMLAPKLKGPKAASEPVRCVAVLSDQPSALALRKGRGNKGSVVTSWRLATIDWKQTSRGYEAMVCFPKRYVSAYDALTLCGAVGHSSWGPSEMAYLKSRNVGASDPACTGGKAWCGARGL